ncbi:MAG TPA: ubiquitin-like domain-containing protein [Candidatus Saccharimonadales bacterium]|nr:ubiquitin-like domain-containing protein [Candidatus Saccharimonadales bacterium]
MNRLIQKTRTPYGAIIAASCLLILILGVVMATRTYAVSPDAAVASGKRLITIHDDGQDKGVLTRATTMRQALAEAKINLDVNDTVEPGLDEELVGNNYEANIYRARPVTIVDGAIRTKVMSPYRTASQIVKQAGMVLQDEDLTKIAANTDLVSEGTGVSLTIDRATPVTLVLYGKQTQTYTQAATVGEMLEEKKVTLAKDDTLSVVQSTPLKSGLIIELWRNGKQTLTQEEEIPFDTDKVQDSAREVGYKEVKTPGEKGKKTVTYELAMKNGKEENRSVIQSVETKKSVKQVEIVGSKLTNTFSGDFAGALARLRSCESGGNYANKKNPKYRGAYQYDYSTWANYGGFYDPADAPPALQDEKAWLTYQKRGWQPWPSCSKSQGLQDIYR